MIDSLFAGTERVGGGAGEGLELRIISGLIADGDGGGGGLVLGGVGGGLGEGADGGRGGGGWFVELVVVPPKKASISSGVKPSKFIF